MPLPFEPETVPVARARFRRAVERPWPYRGRDVTPDEDRPGLHRRHVFDFHDGLRLIVSVATSMKGRHRGEVSASLDDDVSRELAVRLRKTPGVLDALTELAYVAVRRLDELAPGCGYGKAVFTFDTDQGFYLHGWFPVEDADPLGPQADALDGTIMLYPEGKGEKGA